MVKKGVKNGDFGLFQILAKNGVFAYDAIMYSKIGLFLARSPHILMDFKWAKKKRKWWKSDLARGFSRHKYTKPMKSLEAGDIRFGGRL